MQGLAEVQERLKGVEASPILKNGPEHYARTLERGGESLIKTAAQQFQTEARDLQRVARDMASQIASARERRTQNRWLGVCGLAGFAAGILAILFLPAMLPGPVAPHALLACAGFALQRLTRNEMASPEILGVSAGSTFAVAIALFGFGTLSPGGALMTAFAGALATLFLILVLGRRSGYAPERMLLAGIAISALLDAVIGVVTAAGDPRAVQLLSWMARPSRRGSC